MRTIYFAHRAAYLATLDSKLLTSTREYCAVMPVFMVGFI